MFQYRSFKPIGAVRANNAIPPEELPRYERMEWWAQVKKNGTYNLIYVHPDRSLTFTTRRNEEHKAWTPTALSRRAFEEIPGDGWWVFAAELLHSKGGGVKDTNYVHDVLVANNLYLLSSTYAQRYRCLEDTFLKGVPHGTDDHWVINDNTWLARNFTRDFAGIFAGLNGTSDEGLALKNPAGRLRLGSNDAWTVKCRHPKSTSYRF